MVVAAVVAAGVGGVGEPGAAECAGDQVADGGVGIGLDDSGAGRGWLLMVLCLFSAVLSGSRVAVLPDVLGRAPAPTAPGGLLPGS